MINLEHKLHQDMTNASDEQLELRHNLEVQLLEELKAKKEKEDAENKAALLKIQQDFEKMRDYQNALKETADLREKTEENKVKVQHLDIEIQVLTMTTDYLNDKREDLTEDKKIADSKNEELRTQLRAQEEIAKKRLQNSLNRNKSVEIKELIANEEMAKATNDDIAMKLLTERENYDKLMTDKIELVEKLARKTEQLAIDTKEVDEQDKLLAELKAAIEAEQTDVNKLLESVTEERKIKRQEDERNRCVQQENTHLEAKREFIELNYDYTEVAKNMELGIFQSIVESNNDVNATVKGFVDKVGVTKQEVKKLISQRFSQSYY